MVKRKLSSIIIFPISLVFIEFFFRIYNGLPITAISAYLFSIFFGTIIGVICRLFNEKVNKIVSLVFLGLIALLYSAQICLYQEYGFYFSLSATGGAEQLTDYVGKVFLVIISHLLHIVTFFLPCILTQIFNKYLDFKKVKFNDLWKHAIIVVISFLLFFLTIIVNNNDKESKYQLQFKTNNIILSVEKLGVIDTMCNDIFRTIFGFDEDIIIPDDPSQPEDPDEPVIPKEYSYNILDLDIDELISKESNKDVIKVLKYIKNYSGTLENEYTGIFKDKNLIVMMAESFNEIAVSKELTPTLYKMIHEGFDFTNFYTPANYSTIGGEFQELTGLYVDGFISLNPWKNGSNYFPMGLATIFKNLGYKDYAYHDNTYTFQSRNVYLKEIGFDNYLGRGNGLEERMSFDHWPASDTEMFDVTYQDYVNNGKFITFYATVSGHFDYNFKKGDNYIAYTHKEEMYALNLGISEKPLAYLAGQMELDRALASLLNHLKEEGQLENTVIAIVGDHYPYDMTIDECNEIASVTKDETVTIHKSPFILYCADMEKPVVVNKVGFQCDLIPTLYNLFGLDYDSRMFTGRDLLSTEPGLAIFADSSWVSDKGIYYSKSTEVGIDTLSDTAKIKFADKIAEAEANGKNTITLKSTFVPFNATIVSEDYIERMKNEAYNRKVIAKLIITTDFYRRIFK